MRVSWFRDLPRGFGFPGVVGGGGNPTQQTAGLGLAERPFSSDVHERFEGAGGEALTFCGVGEIGCAGEGIAGNEGRIQLSGHRISIPNTIIVEIEGQFKRLACNTVSGPVGESSKFSESFGADAIIFFIFGSG